VGKHEVQLAEVRKHVCGSLAFGAGCMCQPHGLEVWTGLDGFTRFGPTPEPRTGLWVRFGPSAEFWTRPGSGSMRFRSGPKFRTELWHPYH